MNKDIYEKIATSVQEGGFFYVRWMGQISGRKFQTIYRTVRRRKALKMIVMADILDNSPRESPQTV